MSGERVPQILLEILKMREGPPPRRDGRVEIRKRNNKSAPSFITQRVFLSLLYALTVLFSFCQNFYSPRFLSLFLLPQPLPPPRPHPPAIAVSSISRSSRIHLIMAAFPHPLALNHSRRSPPRWVLDPSLYVLPSAPPVRLRPSASLLFCPFTPACRRPSLLFPHIIPGRLRSLPPVSLPPPDKDFCLYNSPLTY